MFDRHKNKLAGLKGHQSPWLELPWVMAPGRLPPAAPPPVTYSTARSIAKIDRASKSKVKRQVMKTADTGRVEAHHPEGLHEVIVGESGEVNANIIAKTVKIDGKVNGDITGTENIDLPRSAMRGNIVAPRVLL